MKTSPSSLKIRQLVTQTREGKLIPQPDFQRRLVWASQDKARFIETLLRSFPFPEIYVANGPVDLDTGAGAQLLVDGQQRVSTIIAYFQGDPSITGSGIPPYSSLSREEKEEFLNYDVAVRDLGSVSVDQIIEVFKRINSTKYPLNEVEINKAVYAGELMRLAEAFSEHDFFDEHKVFRSIDIKRMGDVRFVLQVLITMMAGYFNRDERFEEFLGQFNDSFPERDEVSHRLLSAMNFIQECGFEQRSRVWKKSDLFTILIQVDQAFRDDFSLSPSDALDQLGSFFFKVDSQGLDSPEKAVAVYAKSALQASNDRINRVRRGVIIEALLTSRDPAEALEKLL